MQEELIEQIRVNRPLVHCITNQVTVNYVVNMLLGLGARAEGTDAPEEAAEIAGRSQALMLNVGAPTESLANSMIEAGRRANEMGVPVVLDPDGVGKSSFRLEIVNEILNSVYVTCIRGTATDLAALNGWELEENATLSLDDLQIIADKYNVCVVMTGQEDLVVYHASQARISNNIPFMKRVAGSGAALTAVIAAFLAVGGIENIFDSVVTAVAAFDVAGQKSEAKNAYVGTASFAEGVIDSLSILQASELRTEAKIEER